MEHIWKPIDERYIISNNNTYHIFEEPEITPLKAKNGWHTIAIEGETLKSPREGSYEAECGYIVQTTETDQGFMEVDDIYLLAKGLGWGETEKITDLNEIKYIVDILDKSGIRVKVKCKRLFLEDDENQLTTISKMYDHDLYNEGDIQLSQIDLSTKTDNTSEIIIKSHNLENVVNFLYNGHSNFYVVEDYGRNLTFIQKLTNKRVIFYQSKANDLSLISNMVKTHITNVDKMIEFMNKVLVDNKKAEYESSNYLTIETHCDISSNHRKTTVKKFILDSNISEIEFDSLIRDYLISIDADKINTTFNFKLTRKDFDINKLTFMDFNWKPTLINKIFKPQA